MKASLRSTALAALLLAPLSGAWLAAPAQAAPARAAASPQIASMSLDSDAGLSPGATLRVQLSATPNARRATLALGEGGPTVTLRQQSAGRYLGSYVVRRSDRIDPTTLMTARLTYGERVQARRFNFPPSFQALAMGAATGRADRRDEERDVAVARDERAPRITELSPGNGERIAERDRTLLRAELSDEGSGVDPASVRLRVDGRDVTSDARVTSGEVRYRAELDAGRHTAELTVRDQAGNASTRSWSFEVAPGERLGAAGPGGLPLRVTSHSNNMAVDAAGNLSIQGRTAPHAEVRVLVEAIANAGVLDIGQPVADRSVQADANGYFGVTLPPRGGLPIPGTRYDVRVTATSGSDTAEERLMLVQRQG